MNSNFISVDNLFYALEATDPAGGIATYGVPKPIPGSVKISVDPTIASGDAYGDGAQTERATQFVSAKVSIEAAPLGFQAIADILGHQLDGTGGMIFNKNDHAPYVAFMYRRQKANKHYRYLKLFKTMFADGKEDGETVTNSLKMQNDTIDGVAMPRYSDGNWKSIKDQDEVGYSDVSASWFQNVDGVVVPLAIASISPLNIATGVLATAPVSIAFSTNLSSSTANSNSISLINTVNGTVIPCTIAYIDATKTITVTPKAALTTGTKYIVYVNQDVKDTAGNNLASEYISYFTVA